MKTAEAKKSIREMVKYIISLDDKDVIESYSCTFDDIMESYAKEMTREAWVEIRRDWKCKIKFDQWYNEWIKPE